MDANVQAQLLRVDLEQRANTVVTVLSLPDGGGGWRLIWIESPDETRMRKLVTSVQETGRPRVSLDIQAYERRAAAALRRAGRARLPQPGIRSGRPFFRAPTQPRALTARAAWKRRTTSTATAACAG
ncbi:MAG TPA: hypothetical protein VGL46_14925 [Pseudonocardiaceae bacterium]